MSDRAVSEVISYVLVFALIVSAVGIVSVSGLANLQDTRNDEQVQNAERAFDVLVDNIADIHRRGAPSRATEINLGRAELSTGPNVTIRVNVTESGGGDPEEVVNTSVRPLVYNGDEGRNIVYEAGAVFRTNDDGGLVLQEPPFMAHEDRVLVSVVALQSGTTQSLGGSTVLVRTRRQSTTLEYGDVENDVEHVNVTIVNSRQTGLWNDTLAAQGFTCEAVTVGGDSGIDCELDPSGPSTIDRVYVVLHDITVSIEP